MNPTCTNFPHCLDEPCNAECDQAGVIIRHELAQEAMGQLALLLEEEMDA